MAAGSDEVSFSTDVMRRSGALELVKAIFSRSWTILLAALGAKSDVVADWESGLYPRKPPRLDPGANIISTLKQRATHRPEHCSDECPGLGRRETRQLFIVRSGSSKHCYTPGGAG